MHSANNYLQQMETGLYDYVLVAYTDKAVEKKVMVQQALLVNRFGMKILPDTKPGIMIANFMAREAMEETIVRYTERICWQQQGFEVTVNNYSGFPPHTIYLRIQNTLPFSGLTKELGVVSNYVASCSCPPVKFYLRPYLTIAVCLPDSCYLKAMLQYSQETFHETFLVDELVLLRRSRGHGSFKPVHVFRLLPTAEPVVMNRLYN